MPDHDTMPDHNTMPSHDTTVRFEKRAGVARVTLDRPHVLNAMNERMHVELAAVWDKVEADDEIRVVVITGAGDRAFSVGMDLKERAWSDHVGPAASTIGSRGGPGWPRLTERFGSRKPIIARVNGYALGGGLELALACDLIIATRHAEFGLPEVRRGLIPGAGGVFRLPRQMPPRIALGLLLSGRRFSADDACRFGLINDVVDLADLDTCVDGWVDDLLAGAPLAVQAIRDTVALTEAMPLDRAFATCTAAEERRRRSADAVEGPRAFAEGRTPVWQCR